MAAGCSEENTPYPVRLGSAFTSCKDHHQRMYFYYQLMLCNGVERCPSCSLDLIEDNLERLRQGQASRSQSNLTLFRRKEFYRDQNNPTSTRTGNVPSRAGYDGHGSQRPRLCAARQLPRTGCLCRRGGRL